MLWTIHLNLLNLLEKASKLPDKEVLDNTGFTSATPKSALQVFIFIIST